MFSPHIFQVPECRLSEDLGDIVEKGSFTDVTLCVNNKEFHAHKAILAGKEFTSFFKIIESLIILQINQRVAIILLYNYVSFLI